jgi:hypothetical protein
MVGTKPTVRPPDTAGLGGPFGHKGRGRVMKSTNSAGSVNGVRGAKLGFRVEVPPKSLYFCTRNFLTPTMSLKNAKVLTISQSINPFMDGPEEMAKVARQLPQGILELGNEIRVFMPKFGCINERRHQLHEVIRSAG